MIEVDFDVEGPKVAVVTPSDGPLSRYLPFELSLDGLKVPRGSYPVPVRVSGSDSLANGMNRTIAHLLGEGVRKFFFIDNDHEFDDDTVLKLLRHPAEARVVMALTMRKMPPFNLMGFTDVRQMWDEEAKKVVQQYKNLPWLSITGKSGLYPVRAVGRGGLMVDASVFEELARPWFTVGQIDPEEFLEDIYFSNLCIEGGIPLYVDIGDGTSGPVGTGHTCPVSAFAYRFPDGAMGVELKWPNGKTLVFPITRADGSAEAKQ